MDVTQRFCLLKEQTLAVFYNAGLEYRLIPPSIDFITYVVNFCVLLIYVFLSKWSYSLSLNLLQQQVSNPKYSKLVL